MESDIFSFQKLDQLSREIAILDEDCRTVEVCGHSDHVFFGKIQPVYLSLIVIRLARISNCTEKSVTVNARYLDPANSSDLTAVLCITFDCFLLISGENQ